LYFLFIKYYLYGLVLFLV